MLNNPARLALYPIVVFLIGSLGSVPTNARERLPGIFGVFGGIINSATVDTARQQWQRISATDYNCLMAHNLSIAQLSERGIGPDDQRIQQILAQCPRAAPVVPTAVLSQPDVAPTSPHIPNFVVDGLTLGATVYPDSPVYKAYKCRASDQFPGYTWCSVRHPMTGKFGPFDSWVTILHSDANAAVFINQKVIPAYFMPGDVDREIQRLSAGFGQAARILTGDPRPDAPRSVLAVWGDVTLTPLDEQTMGALRRGETITAGLLVDYLNDARKSARENLPVFHLGGGAGFIWNAQFDDNGKGVLNIAAINASMLPSSPAETNPPPADLTPSYAPPASPQTPPVPETTLSDAERAARLERATAAARTQLDDASSFIKDHPQHPKLLDYIQLIGALSNAVKSADSSEIERNMTQLSNALSHDKDYQRHLADVVEAQKRTAIQYLGDAIHHGEQQKAFLLGYIANNPLASPTPAFATFIKQLNAALPRPELNELQPLVDKIDLAIREADLEKEFVSAQKSAAAPLPGGAEGQTSQAASSGPPNAATGQLPVTDKNRFLAEGDLNDVEILYNASATAPHIAQNLRGEFVFAGGEAKACIFGQNSDDLARIVEQTLSTFHPNPTAITIEACNPWHLENYDIVATQRGAFLRSKRDEALALMKTIEGDAYRQLVVVAAADLKKAADAERNSIEEFKAKVVARAPDAYGIVLVRTGSASLCLAAVDKVEAHQQLLLTAESKISFDMRTGPTIAKTNIDDAFVSIQKHQCGAVYASAADLRTLTSALERDSIPYAFSSVWFRQAEMEREDAALVERRRVDAQQMTERAQQAADETRLAAQRSQDLNATQSAQQAALRERFGDSAKAAAASLASDVTSYTHEQRGLAAALYPDYATWLAQKLKDHWEVMKIDSDTQDFGTSDFKSRRLDTAFARIKMRLRNQMLGEYQDACFVFGRINDAEFSTYREPMFARCDDPSSLDLWQAGHQFLSEWSVSKPL